LCTGCAVCVDFCPSDALSLVSPGDETEPALEQSTLDNSSQGSREQLDIDLKENMTG
ncbi:4Fe-4S binding protein, partial [bacterium]|nr:4Fe-4S binding protein [bacterium]